MIKHILVALPTAVLAFAAGVWVEGERHPKQAVAIGVPLTHLPKCNAIRGLMTFPFSI
jgi:hypothetical protein